MKNGELITNVNWMSELCCEYCGDIIHNHFDCPICNFKNAGTSIYCATYELSKDDKEFECEECRAKFLYVGYKNHEHIIKYIGDNKNDSR